MNITTKITLITLLISICNISYAIEFNVELTLTSITDDYIDIIYDKNGISYESGKLNNLFDNDNSASRGINYTGINYGINFEYENIHIRYDISNYGTDMNMDFSYDNYNTYIHINNYGYGIGMYKKL